MGWNFWDDYNERNSDSEPEPKMTKKEIEDKIAKLKVSATRISWEIEELQKDLAELTPKPKACEHKNVKTSYADYYSKFYRCVDCGKEF